MRYRYTVSLCVLSCCWLLASCRFMPDPAALAFAPADPTLWLVFRDWHTSLLIDGDLFRRYSTVWRRQAALQLEVEAARAVRVGWGDGDYFTGKSTSTATAARALVASDNSALQFIGYERDPLPTIPPTTRAPLRVSEAGIAALVAYIDASVLDKAGALVPLQSYVENAGVFLASNRHYGLFNNCNTWTGTALQRAGLPVHSALHLTPASIFAQAQAIASIQSTLPITASGEVSVP